MQSARIGIVGGSGLYKMDGLQNLAEVELQTPFGVPSEKFVIGDLDGVRVAFLARHGRNHSWLPHEVPYRANIHGFKQLGVEYLLSVSAVGSLREGIKPLDLVLPDQFLDMTQRRQSTFFGSGAVAHVSMADPVCLDLHGLLWEAACNSVLGEVGVHRGGTYVCIDGPTFSTRAESHWYRSLGADVIGMTNMPEAKLAREAEIAYATMALVTDWDCWHPHQACVTAELAIASLQANAARAQRVVSCAVRLLSRGGPPSSAHRALDSALVTSPDAMPPEMRARVDLLLHRYVSKR